MIPPLLVVLVLVVGVSLVLEDHQHRCCTGDMAIISYLKKRGLGIP